MSGAKFFYYTLLLAFFLAWSQNDQSSSMGQILPWQPWKPKEHVSFLRTKIPFPKQWSRLPSRWGDSPSLKSARLPPPAHAQYLGGEWLFVGDSTTATLTTLLGMQQRGRQLTIPPPESRSCRKSPGRNGSLQAHYWVSYTGGHRQNKTLKSHRLLTSVTNTGQEVNGKSWGKLALVRIRCKQVGRTT